MSAGQGLQVAVLGLPGSRSKTRSLDVCTCHAAPGGLSQGMRASLHWQRQSAGAGLRGLPRRGKPGEAPPMPPHGPRCSLNASGVGRRWWSVPSQARDSGGSPLEEGKETKLVEHVASVACTGEEVRIPWEVPHLTECEQRGVCVGGGVTPIPTRWPMVVVVGRLDAERGWRWSCVHHRCPRGSKASEKGPCLRTCRCTRPGTTLSPLSCLACRVRSIWGGRRSRMDLARCRVSPVQPRAQNAQNRQPPAPLRPSSPPLHPLTSGGATTLAAVPSPLPSRPASIPLQLRQVVASHHHRPLMEDHSSSRPRLQPLALAACTCGLCKPLVHFSLELTILCVLSCRRTRALSRRPTKVARSSSSDGPHDAEVRHRPRCQAAALQVRVDWWERCVCCGLCA